jgi:hypothetical protein
MEHNKKELTRLISAFLLGDGCLRTWRGVKNAAYSFGQILIHDDYITFQESILSELTRVKRYVSAANTDNNGVNHQPTVKLSTLSHPFYTTMRERFYFDGRKTVSTHDLLLFDWQSAAIWFMDDGYRLKSEDTTQRGNVFLCTDNYTHAEVILLQKAIYEKLSIAFNIRKRGFKKDGTQIYRLVATKDNAAKFIEGVTPFVFPSFEYKLSSERKLSTYFVENDIV